jgi:hypothetical protein
VHRRLGVGQRSRVCRVHDADNIRTGHFAYKPVASVGFAGSLARALALVYGLVYLKKRVLATLAGQRHFKCCGLL